MHARARESAIALTTINPPFLAHRHRQVLLRSGARERVNFENDQVHLRDEGGRHHVKAVRGQVVSGGGAGTPSRWSHFSHSEQPEHQRRDERAS
jgi:hypothetical protein